MKLTNKHFAIFACAILSTFVMARYTLSAPESKHPAPRLQRIQKILIIGNSLTRHGPSTKKLGWTHDFGMAATKEENDYVHQLYSKICAVQEPAGRKPELKVMSMIATNIKTPPEAVQYAADYIVLQMGDNLPAAKATKENFVEPYIQLVNALKKARPDAMIFITSLWGGEAKRNDFVQEVCSATGSTFVDLRPIAKDPKNRAASENVYQNPGVRWHPGDRGMKAIADTIWQETLKAQKANPPENIIRNQ